MLAKIMQFITNALHAAALAITRGALPKDNSMLAADLIYHQNLPFGPSPVTGGLIHKISQQQAQSFAAAVLTSMDDPQPRNVALRLPVVLAWLCGESRFDRLAINPNKNKAKPGETAEEAFLHTDYGAAQIDGATLVGDDPAVPYTALIAKAYSLDFAIPWFFKEADGLMDWAMQTYVPAYAKLCNGDWRVLGFNAYNAGRTGTLRQLAAGKPLAYGLALAARAATFEAALKG